MGKGKRVATRRTGWQARMIAFHRHWEGSNTLACNSSGISSTLWQPLVLITISYGFKVANWSRVRRIQGANWSMCEEIPALQTDPSYFSSTCQDRHLSVCEAARTGSAIKAQLLAVLLYTLDLFGGILSWLVAEINRTGSIGRWRTFFSFSFSDKGQEEIRRALQLKR